MRVASTPQPTTVNPIPPTTISAEEQTDNCSICLEALVTNLQPQNLITLGCDHIYHRTCIEEWVKTKATCCICRQEVPVVNTLGLSVPHEPSTSRPIENGDLINASPPESVRALLVAAVGIRALQRMRVSETG